MTDAFHTQIKAAQRDLIGAAGGIARVARLTDYGTSTVGRWNSPADQEHMPLKVVRLLERDTDQPLVTTILAHETGRKVLEPNGPATDAATLDAMVRRLVVDVMELAGSAAVATADKHVSPAESTTMHSPASRACDTLRQIEQLLATVKAAGGASAELRLVQGD